MGLIRGGLTVIVSILIFILLLAGGLFLTLEKSLDHDIIEENILPEISRLLESEINISKTISQESPTIDRHCQNNTNYTFKNSEINATLSCEMLQNRTDSAADYLLQEEFEKAYYKEYSCEFIECLEEEPLVMISQHAQTNWRNLFLGSILISVILLAILLFLVEKKLNMPITTGIFLAITGLIVSKIGVFLGFIKKSFFVSESLGIDQINIVQDIMENLFQVVSTQAFGIGLWMIIIGVIILVFAIPLKIWMTGVGISEKFKSWFSKGEKKEETKPTEPRVQEKPSSTSKLF